MNYDASMDAVFQSLERWRTHPKYALERRLDIFLTPFLGPYLTKRHGGRATLVAPEFPLLSGLQRLRPDQKPPKKGFPALTVNLDYLFHIAGSDPHWLFLELKTDPESNREKQAALYRRARRRGMELLRGDVVFVQGKTKGAHNKEKYGRVRAAVDGAGALSERIELAYLSPTPPPAPPKGAPAEERSPIVHHALSDFAGALDWEVPREHGDLWTKVSALLEETSRPRAQAPARGGRG